MHPLVNLVKQLLPEADLPSTPISDAVDYCLSMKMSSMRSPADIINALDKIGDAQVEVNDLRVQLAHLKPQVQAQGRRIEKTVRSSDTAEKKTTVTAQTRKLKTDESWIKLNCTESVLEGMIEYCDQVQALLESKIWNLRMMLKDKHA